MILKFKDYIGEGLIYSWKRDTFMNKLSKVLDKYGDYLTYTFDDNDELIVGLNLDFEPSINKKVKTQMWNDIQQLLNSSGYLITNYTGDKRAKTPLNLEKFLEPRTYFRIVLTSKFSDRSEKPKSNIVYHVCNQFNLDKILKYGIQPKSKNVIEYHPERVYVFDNLEMVKFYIDKKKTMVDYYPTDFEQKLMKAHKVNTIKFHVLEIDTTGLDLKFYMDPKFELEDGAFYTYGTIPPKAIKQIK